jgi:hypothetical protein
MQHEDPGAIHSVGEHNIFLQYLNWKVDKETIVRMYNLGIKLYHKENNKRSLHLGPLVRL